MPVRREIAKGRASRAEAIKETLASLPSVARDFSEHSAIRQSTYPEKLKPWHHLLLIKLLAGEKPTSIAAELGRSLERVNQVTHSPLFKSIYDAIVQKRYESVVEGEHGVTAQARAEAPQAMVRLVALSKSARDNVKLDAIKHVLALAGATPIQRTETFAVDKLLEELDRRELEVFSTTGRMPRRLADKIALTGREFQFHDEGEPIDVTPVDIPPGPEEDGDA